jgi:hypothetical protein
LLLLAHRGWWKTPEEKNSETAIRRAFDAGYGVETDLRDHDGQVVISHDPPVGQGHITLDTLLEWYAAAGQPGRLALNIKADGLQRAVADALSRHAITRYFVFDMSVADAVGYMRAEVDCFSRISEYEPSPSFEAQAKGVWMDAFVSDWIEPRHIQPWLDAGKLVALVSPELHKREARETWARWAKLDAWGGENLMLCTDFPDAAEAFFKSGRDLVR